MARFRKRGETWTIEVRRKGFKPIARTFDKKADGEKWAADVEAKMLAGRYVDTREAESLTLAEALERYGREVTPSKKGAKIELLRLCRWQRSALAGKSLAALRSSDLAAWRDKRLAEGQKPNTVRLDLALISHLYTIAAKEWGLPVDNPCAKIRKPSAGQGREVRMSADQEALILVELAKINPELVAWATLAVESGMRRGELASLRREWFVGRVVRIPDTKNGEPRRVPLSSRAVSALASLPVLEDGRVFALSLDWVTKAFSLAAARAGHPEIRFHDLRHEATSRLFERGLNPMEVAAITGHKTLIMLKRYTHLNAERLADKLA
jgi:integrase